jgi:hypothetical protein
MGAWWRRQQGYTWKRIGRHYGTNLSSAFNRTKAARERGEIP